MPLPLHGFAVVMACGSTAARPQPTAKMGPDSVRSLREDESGWEKDRGRRSEREGRGEGLWVKERGRIGDGG